MEVMIPIGISPVVSVLAVVSQISKETINAGKDYVINNPLLRERA